MAMHGKYSEDMNASSLNTTLLSLGSHRWVGAMLKDQVNELVGPLQG